MATNIPNINKIKSGLCPHGLPPGACPICSNMGGGGSMRAGERPQKVGEMSYHECAMIGNMIKARQLAQKQHAQQLKQNAEILKTFEFNMLKLSQNLRNFVEKFSHNILLKPAVLIAKNIAMPIINFIKNIPKIVLVFSNIKFEIQDKLNAIFGEIKNFIQKRISDTLNIIKNKLKDLFKIFKKNNSDDEDTKIDDDKKIFNLKTILQKIIRKKKEKDGNSSKNK